MSGQLWETWEVGPDLDEFRQEHGITGPHHYIYGLFDPRTGTLRYVGKSDRPRERLTNQMNEVSATHRCHWVQELRGLGLKPVQRIIDAVPAGGDWQAVERAYIAAVRSIGEPLTNGTDGGDGVTGLSDEVRAKMRATWTGRKHRPESLAKIGAASKGRVHTQEWREYMSARMKDREFSPEHRRKISQALRKFNPDQVREIRALLAAKVSQYEIAAQFGVTQGAISAIARGKTYKEEG